MDTIIGLEIHLQLATNSKMFCSCSASYFEKPANSQTCPVCMGFPGALPIPNKRALELCILMGLATNCSINTEIKFDRKHYFYPDLPKGYQISQYDEPVCSDGGITIKLSDGSTKEILIERIHQEEDVAKSFHMKDPISGNDYTLIDYNKSGVPLIEIVSKPVIRSAQEAKLYATKIRQIARYLGISDADMEKGQMRCEPNISIQEAGKWKLEDGKIKPLGDYKLNPKVEVKNIGSISAVEKAVEYEVKRMTEELAQGRTLTQQTRGWNAEKGITEFQRSKESAEDYRYFREPDIPTIVVEDAVVERVAEELVELPDEKETRYKHDYNLSDYDTSVLTASKANAEYFEALVEVLSVGIDESNREQLAKKAKLASNWITGVIFAYLNKENRSIDSVHITPAQLAEIINKVEQGKVNNGKAKEIVMEALEKDIDVIKLYKESGAKVVADTGALEQIVEKVISENPKAVEDYRGGKEATIGFLIGQAMKASQGNGNPNTLREIFITKLKS